MSKQSQLPDSETDQYWFIDWLSDPYADDDETTDNGLDEGYLEPWDEDTD